MIQKPDISVLILDSRSVFVAAALTNPERERNYGQQTLATCTVLRSHLRRGVVNMVLVRVSVKYVGSTVFV